MGGRDIPLEDWEEYAIQSCGGNCCGGYADPTEPERILGVLNGFEISDFNVEALVDKNAAVARVSFVKNGVWLLMTGSSKRNIGEPSNAERGYDLAVARALRKVADSLENLHPDDEE